MTKYVGLQEENTGPKEAPIIMSPQKLSFFTPCASTLLDFRLSARLSFIEIFSHRDGKRVMSPNMIRIPPERYCQNVGGMLIKTVATFRIKVKRMTETVREAVITYGFSFDLTSETELPMITGSNGSTQGASTVSIPAINEISKKVIDKLG